jgi:hypothetical protein
MNAPSVDIAAMLTADSSLNLVIATNMFIGKEPVAPHNSITILDMEGRAPQLTYAGQGEAYYYPLIQIRVRNKDYRTGWNLTHNIMESLHGRAGETWNDALYTVIYCSGGPALLDWDDNELVTFIVNFNLQRRPSTDSSGN